MKILGISGLYHDSAACLIDRGELVAAAQEERFTRIKNDLSFPVNAMKYCMDEAGIDINDVDYIAYYDNPIISLDRTISNALHLGKEIDNSMDDALKRLFSLKLWINDLIKLHFPEWFGKHLLVCKHHVSHAASAFYPSPFEEAAILTIDGVGEWATTSIGLGRGNSIELKKEIRYPSSLGLLYSAFAYYCGFKVNSGEYKFMGLAPYGSPIYYDVITKNIIDIKPDGSFALNLDYFDYYKGGTMVNDDKMKNLLGCPRRKPESVITKQEMDIAASVQKIVEEIILKISRHIRKEYGIPNLCLAGGVALNCVANGRLFRENIFDNIWVQPAAGDAGGALGAAMYAYFSLTGNERKVDGKSDFQKGTYLGPSFSDEEIKSYLGGNGIKYHVEKESAKKIASLLSEGKVIGFFAGRMEYGPRALGHRSILADPRKEDMQVKLNMKIKYRESFRPFAPAVLEEDAADYFEMDKKSPYMLFCTYVKEDLRKPFDVNETLKEYDMDMLAVVGKSRSQIPAVTHVDYSVRLQTVDGEYNPELYSILKEFKKLTGCSVLVNTSFNVRGEPIVCTPGDAYKCFMGTEMDVLAYDNIILYKEEQVQSDGKDYKNEYEPD